jgi:hypothetical protein
MASGLFRPAPAKAARETWQPSIVATRRPSGLVFRAIRCWDSLPSQNAPAAFLESWRGGGKAALVIECLCGHPEKMADGARFVCDFQPPFRALAQSIDDGEDQVSANL